MRWVLLPMLVLATISPDFMPPRIIATVKSPDGRTAIEIRR